MLFYIALLKYYIVNTIFCCKQNIIVSCMNSSNYAENQALSENEKSTSEQDDWMLPKARTL